MVDSGQLEFVTGGAVSGEDTMASTEMVLRNLEEGHRFLYETFGIAQVPIAWQTASLGHSSHAAHLLSQAGYTAVILDKVNVDFRAKLAKESNLEFRWTDGLLTHILHDSYRFPEEIHPDNPNGCWQTSLEAW